MVIERRGTGAHAQKSKLSDNRLSYLDHHLLHMIDGVNIMHLDYVISILAFLKLIVHSMQGTYAVVNHAPHLLETSWWSHYANSVALYKNVA